MEMKRRDFLKGAATVAGTALVVPGLISGCRMKADAFSLSPGADAMDEALARMSKLPPLGNHGPMAVEALIALGRPDRTIPFIDKYKGRFRTSQSSPVESINEKNWQAALGRGDRNLDWTRFFAAALIESDWKQVLEKWTAVLAPGLCAAAGHGVIRTCHAARSLSIKQTPLRRHELAEGLGYWAAYYQRLPENGAAGGKARPLQAIEKVPLLPNEKRLGGSIMNQLTALDGFPDFAKVMPMVDTEGNAGASLSELTEAFAGVYLKNVNGRNDLILLHAVTVAAGLRSLLPYLTPATTQKTLAYGWQAAAGLFSIGASRKANDPPKDEPIKIEDLVERAAQSNEEHAIKFTEACLREYSFNPKQVYLQAAHEGLRRLPSF